MKLKSIIYLLLVVVNVGCSSSYNLTNKAQKVINDFSNIKSTEKLELLDGTPYSTPAFIFDSKKSGKTVMILGGTHGNEPAGYEAALRILKLLERNPPKNGKVIVIPLANRQADKNYERRIPVPNEVKDIERGNLNRCYPGDKNGLPMEKMAYEITEIAKKNKIDVFIDLHEARYFHLNTPKESKREKGLGQTIFYYPNEESSWLVMNLLDNINENIDDPNEKFSAVEQPIMHSAAWWAGKELNIAAFTFETMRKLDLEKRIYFHIQLVKIALEKSDIW